MGISYNATRQWKYKNDASGTKFVTKEGSLNNRFEDAVTTLKDPKSKFSGGDLTNLMEASSTFKTEKNMKKN